MAKAYVGDVTGEIMDQCLQFHGGMGYLEDLWVARAWRDARLFRIGGFGHRRRFLDGLAELPVASPGFVGLQQDVRLQQDQFFYIEVAREQRQYRQFDLCLLGIQHVRPGTPVRILQPHTPEYQAGCQRDPELRVSLDDEFSAQHARDLIFDPPFVAIDIDQAERDQHQVRLLTSAGRPAVRAEPPGRT